MTAPDHEVAIIGTGFSGLGAAIRLRKEGIDDFVLLEKARDLGGTWRDNDYPGLAVDMPSFIYSYPFEMSAEWSRVYAPAREIKTYADHCADRYRIRSHIRFGQTVEWARYDGRENLWRLELSGERALTARYLVCATGLLVEPRMPEIEGIDRFRGELLHSARWDHGYDVSGKRVAVIGTGATAVQLVPAIAPEVARLDVYQRTAIWLMGKPDAEIGERLQRIFRLLPFLQTWIRLAINLLIEVMMGMGFVRYTRNPWLFGWLERRLIDSMRAQVDDPEVQEKLIPRYSFFCKRPSFSNEYYPTFNRPNVELVTDPIERITETSIITRDGEEREIDALVCATGYSVFDRSCMPNFEIVGREGVNLGEFWDRNRYQAYEGATVPGFPNLFLMMGPYSAAGASYFTMIDTQTRHLGRCLREACRRGSNYIEVRREAHERDFARMLVRRETTVLFGGNCAPSNSYYFDRHGDTPSLRPVTGLEHWLHSRLFPLSDYQFDRRQA